MNRNRTGNGRDCITVPAHGPAFVLRDGQEWCAHQSHDGAPAREGAAAIPATTPWLAKQESKTPEA